MNKRFGSTLGCLGTMYTFLIIVFHVYLGLLWRVHTREHGSGMLSLVLEFIKVSLFPGGCIPECCDKWKAIECVLSLLLRVTGFDERKMHALLPPAVWGSIRLD